MPRGAKSDPSGAAGRPLTASRWGWAAVLASLAFAGALWTRHVAASGSVAGLFHDEGVYLVTARALAGGAGYRVISTPGAPPEVRYPPLLPLALASVWRLAPRFPDNLPFLKGVSLLAAFALVVVLPGYLQAAGLSPPIAFATAVLTAAAPLTMRYATAVASELPFALLAVAALWLIERATRPRGGPGAAALAGATAGLAFLTRTVGAAVVLAGIAMLLRRADRRRALAFTLPAALLALSWAAWLVLQRGQAGGADYLTAFASDGPPGTGQLLEHLLALPAAVGIVTVPGLADLLPEATPWPLLLTIYVLGAVTLAGVWRQRFGGYVAASLAIAVAVPWFQPRFLLPLAPLFLAGLLSAVLPSSSGISARATSWTVLAVLLAAALAGNRVRLASVRASGLPALEEGMSGPGGWADLEATLDWVRAVTAPDDVVACFHDPLVYLYTGRQAVQAYPSIWRPEARQVSAMLADSRARWLLDLPCPERGVWAGAHVAWSEWIAAHRAFLTPVYAGPRGHTRVFRLDPAITTTGPPDERS